MNVRFAAAFLILGLLVGCQTNPVNLGPQAGVEYDAATVRQVEARACGFGFLVFPVTTHRVYERALTKLRGKAPFDYLTEIRAQPYWRTAVLGWFQCVKLVADAHPTIATREEHSLH